MEKLSKLSDNMFLFSDRTDEIVLVSSIREYIECGEENLGEYHTIRFNGDGSLTLINRVDIEN